MKQTIGGTFLTPSRCIHCVLIVIKPQTIMFEGPSDPVMTGIEIAQALKFKDSLELWGNKKKNWIVSISRFLPFMFLHRIATLIIFIHFSYKFRLNYIFLTFKLRTFLFLTLIFLLFCTSFMIFILYLSEYYFRIIYHELQAISRHSFSLLNKYRFFFFVQLSLSKKCYSLRKRDFIKYMQQQIHSVYY